MVGLHVHGRNSSARAVARIGAAGAPQQRVSSALAGQRNVSSSRSHNGSSALGLLNTLRQQAAGTERATKATSRLRAGKRKKGSKRAGDVASAHALLNGMVEQFVKKIDMQQISCGELTEKQATMLELARRDLGEYNTQGALARARVLAAQIAISSAEEKLPKLSDALALHKAKCNDNTAALHKQMNLIGQDAGTLSSVMDMSSCSSAAASSFIACGHPAEGLSFITFNRRVLRKKAAQLRTDTAKRALHRALKESVRPRRGIGHAARVGGNHTKISSHHEGKHHHHHHHGKHPKKPKSGHARKQKREAGLVSVRRAANATITNATNGTTNGTNGTTLHDPTSIVPWDWRRRQRKCALREKADCGTLQDKLLLMQIGISDKIDNMKEDISKAGSLCEVTQQNYNAQIDDLQSRLEDQQAALAEATKVVVEAQEQSRLMAQQLAQLQSEGRRTTEQCDAGLRDLDAQICSARQIRQELYSADSAEEAPFIQDCEVSAWTPEECSLECGGGVQNMSRSVVVPQSDGAACPPLMMQRRCNEQPCPSDCRLDEWGGWSACSAECGGGIMERVRGIQSQPKHGGKPCGSTFESRSCNADACDADCALSDWSAWSECSKECDVGFMERRRTPLTPAKGQGSCPSEDSLARLEYMHCNTKACEPKHGDTLRCMTKLDAILLLDGSGSVSDEGWEATIAVGRMISEALLAGGTGTQVAVLLYSGPSSWGGYQKCASGNSSVDLATDCNVQWASHFSSDAAALDGAISGLTWPKGTTMTSTALASAASELHSGSSDGRERVVIVITDGRHMNPHQTSQAAALLRQQARLMWVPATEHASINEIKGFASTPIASNIVALRNFTGLAEVGTVNKIIADACRDVE